MAKEQILEKGWRRHSVISSYQEGTALLLPHLPEIITNIVSAEGAIILVSTYDCAVVSPCFESEPWVQLLVAFPAMHEKKYAKGRDPRRLHFTVIHEGEDLQFETNASCICQVSRELLLQIEPDTTYKVDDTAKYDLKNWLAERFRQDTWPNAFNAALKPAEKRLKRFWQRYNEYISGMYIKLNTYKEIEEGKYSASIIVAVEAEKMLGLIRKLRAIDNSLKGKPIKEVMIRLESTVISAFGNTILIDEDPTKSIGKAVEFIEEGQLSVTQLRHFPRFSPYSLSEFDSIASLPVDMVPAKTL